MAWDNERSRRTLQFLFLASSKCRSPFVPCNESRSSLGIAKRKRVDLKTARYRLVDIRKFARAEIARAWQRRLVEYNKSSSSSSPRRRTRCHRMESKVGRLNPSRNPFAARFILRPSWHNNGRFCFRFSTYHPSRPTCPPRSAILSTNGRLFLPSTLRPLPS